MRYRPTNADMTDYVSKDELDQMNVMTWGNQLAEASEEETNTTEG